MIIRVKRLAIMTFLDKMIRGHWRMFLAHRKVTLDKWQKMFIVVRVSLLWTQIQRRSGPAGWRDMQLKKIRMSFNFAYMLLKDQVEEQQMEFLRSIFKNVCHWLMTQTLRTKAKHFSV